VGTFCETPSPRLAGSEKLILRLDIDIALISTPSRRVKFEVGVRDAVSASLNLPRERVVIQSVRSGSLLVDLLILADSSGGGVSARAAAYTLAMMINEGAVIFPATFRNDWNMPSGGTSVATSDDGVMGTLAASPSPADSGAPAALFWGIGGAILAAFIAAMILFKFCRRQKPSGKAVDPWQTLLGGGQTDSINSLSSRGPHDPRRLYEQGCEHFGNTKFIKARGDFDKAIAVLTHKAGELHAVVKLPQTSRHADVISSIGAALADGMVLKQRFDQATTNTHAQTGEEVAKKLNGVLSFFAIHTDIERAISAKSSRAADHDELWASLKATGLCDYTEQAREAQDQEAVARLLQEARQLFLIRGMPNPSELARLQADVSLKLLLHRCVAQKIGVATFLACNRLDRKFVRLAQQPLVKTIDIRHRLRLTLLSLFLSGVSCEPKYRVRYIRYTIKVNMALGNYGLAASYLRLLLKYAKSNTDKLRQELAQCESHNNENCCEPEEMVPPGSPYFDLLRNVEQARQISSELGDSIGESRELGIIGLVHWQTDAFAEAEQVLALSCKMAHKSKDTARKSEERSSMYMLRLAKASSSAM
jgi:hypothetical protein